MFDRQLKPFFLKDDGINVNPGPGTYETFSPKSVERQGFMFGKQLRHLNRSTSVQFPHHFRAFDDNPGPSHYVINEKQVQRSSQMNTFHKADCQERCKLVAGCEHSGITPGPGAYNAAKTDFKMTRS